MSTRDLRRAALQGVDVRAITSAGAQQACLALLVTLFAVYLCERTFVWMSDLNYCLSKIPFSYWLSVFALTVQNVAAMSSWFLAGRDRKPFIASSFVQLQLLQIILYRVTTLVITDDSAGVAYSSECSDQDYSLPHFLAGIQVPLAVMILAVMLCCCRGPHCVARIPFLGAWLAGVLGPRTVICPRRIDQGKAYITPSRAASLVWQGLDTANSTKSNNSFTARQDNFAIGNAISSS
eukprot:TRINITY_DN18571_c0_g1_i2.p1 TRINITY_DN18571_c0_g1~~TRINITY_DN18571_c0_g1_i2.p1  ORF type:complete len:236 (-),score=14.98 TRINITY_DN18571_c0_g1_i2:186-893(-)